MTFRDFLALSHLLRPHATPHESPYITAIFALIGVVIGGAINVSLAMWLDRRNRLKAEAERKEKFKVACRVVYRDLMHAYAIVDAFAQFPEDVPDIKTLHPDLRSWDAHKEIIAANISAEDWEKLVRASVLALLTDDMMHTEYGRKQPNNVRRAKVFAEHIKKAIDAITPYTK
jgi:hypothetical protein